MSTELGMLVNRLTLGSLLFYFRGHVGIQAFGHILRDPRVQDIPLVLETPLGEDENWAVWEKEINALHTMSISKSGANEEEEAKLLESIRDVVKQKAPKAKKVTTKRTPAKPKGRKAKGKDADDDGGSDDYED